MPPVQPPPRRPFRKFPFFGACLALCLAALELYARIKVTATPAGQALARYRPDGHAHAVFLGSSLTDAGIRTELLDSLQAAREGGAPPFRSFNLALAGLNGSANYYLLFKNFILPRGRPGYLVVEAPGVPFFPPADPFRLEGDGLRVESFRPELMEYRDFRYLAGGFPGAAASLSFWLHKHWRAYHYRLEIQARIHERLSGLLGRFPDAPPAGDAGTGREPYPVYHMAADAYAMFAESTRKDLERMEAPGGVAAMRRREAHLLDLAASARANGVRLVVLKPPCPPRDRETAKVPAFGLYDQGFRALCDSLGVRYLDLSGEKSCGPYAFPDGIHLDPASARRFTACVSRALIAPYSAPSCPHTGN
ncbi:MAG TPA: hypothetical protein VJ385_19580 [Fibrobacteria bacterium]|nr:hypothetical protein [Fibrobacteria bacterium]